MIYMLHDMSTSSSWISSAPFGQDSEDVLTSQSHHEPLLIKPGWNMHL